MDLVEFCTALALIDDTNAELHDKEVTLTTSDVTGSQTAIFEYDPQNEPVSGDPPGPWDGYSLFTIDLSGVKDDIEDLQQQIADAEACRQQVISVLQQYDPDYDPDEGECPADKVTEVVDKVEELKEQVEECDQCKADVIAKLQEYDPDFDPQTCSDIPPEIDKAIEEAIEEAPDKYTFDPEVPIGDISSIVAGEPIGTPNSDYYLDVYVHAYQWGVSPPQVYEGRTVYATSETGELGAQMCADIVDGSGTVVRHYIESIGHSVYPQLNGYAQISDYSITNDTITINMFIYRNDGWSSTSTTTFSDLLFADFATGPYTVRKK